jgi:dextranase
VLIPDRATYAPGQEVVLVLSEAAAEGVLTVSRLQDVVERVTVPAGATEVRLGPREPGGYGVRLGEAASAFDVLASPFDRPRYGFVVKLTDDVDVVAVTRNFRRNHLNLAQLYDWGYRHSQLMPPTDHYVDPLGQERDIAVVNRMSRELAAAGTVPLGYSAVYAIGHDEVDDWRGSLLLRPDGEPYRLGDDFLVLVDPGVPPGWRTTSSSSPPRWRVPSSRASTSTSTAGPSSATAPMASGWTSPRRTRGCSLPCASGCPRCRSCSTT